MTRQLGQRLMVRLLLLLLFAFSSATTTAKERITYFHNDLLGSPVAATNAQGDVLWQEEYTAYGKRLLKADQGRNSRWFTGKSEAAALSVQYFDARWYDADLGRFLSVDPVDFQEGDVHSFNRYTYANNNPYRYVDPNGESPLDVGFLIVDVVKLGAAVYSGVGVGAAAADVGFSVIGVLSPVPGMGVLSKTAYLARAVKASKTVDKAADVAKGTAADRATQIHSVLDPRAQRARTTAVTETQEGVRVISSSERRLTPAQRAQLGANEVEGVGVGHAEVTGVNAARGMGLTPTGTAASRPICPSCAGTLREQGIDPLSPLK